jgi:aerobic-type carbon monoxide dehydrogenase small subunit (CoxS/CutS family)
MAQEIRLQVNGQPHTISAEPDMPLLYALANDLQLKGPRFGCGLAQCGSCSVLLDGVEVRSCILPVQAAQGREITTLEGLPQRYAERRGDSQTPALHPVQQAMLDEQAVQCGYCYNGIIVKAVELLERNPDPSDADIRSAMNGHLCRCGTYPRIIAAIRRAAQAIRAAQV